MLYFWMGFTEAMVDMMLEPLIDAYWEYEYRRACRGL